MGGFYGSIHVRTDSNQPVKDVLEVIAKKKKHKFYLSPPINGWVSIFPEGSGQDERVSKYIAKYLDYDILHLLVHDDGIFCYWYYHKGSLIDEYNSHPGYFGEFVSRRKREKLKGNPDVFKDRLVDHSKLLEIREVLRKPYDFSKNISEGKKITEKFKIIQKKLKEIKKIINNPDLTHNFLSENPKLLEDKMKSMAQEAKNKGLKSHEEIQNLITKPENLQDIMGTLLTGLVKSSGISNEVENIVKESSGKPQSESDNDTGKSIADKGMLTKPPEGLFASETMRKFADILGIPNAITSYEYLDSGEIEDILEWDRFIKIC
jgi:hypothetical protein